MAGSPCTVAAVAATAGGHCCTWNKAYAGGGEIPRALRVGCWHMGSITKLRMGVVRPQRWWLQAALRLLDLVQCIQVWRWAARAWHGPWSGLHSCMLGENSREIGRGLCFLLGSECGDGLG